MRPGKSIAACAVATLAMVFSVQQGEHGPLVVYKLEVPKRTAPAAPLPAAPAVIPAKPDSAPAQRLSPLKPTVLGTVVMPLRPQPATRPPVRPAALPSALPLSLLVPAPVLGTPAPPAPVFRTTAGAEIAGENMINEETGETLTLDEVTDAVEWRRDTVERLNATPGAFGF